MRGAESGGWVKGAKRDRSHAQQREHGEDRPLDAPEHPAGLEGGWAKNITPLWLRATRVPSDHAACGCFHR